MFSSSWERRIRNTSHILTSVRTHSQEYYPPISLTSTGKPLLYHA